MIFRKILNIGPFYRFKFVSDLEHNNVHRISDPLIHISLGHKLTTTTRACDIVLEMIKTELTGSDWIELPDYSTHGWAPSDTRIETEFDFIDLDYDDDEKPITREENALWSRDLGLGKIQGRNGRQYNVCKTVMISSDSRPMLNSQGESENFKTTILVYYFISMFDGTRGNRMIKIEFLNEKMTPQEETSLSRETSGISQRTRDRWAGRSPEETESDEHARPFGEEHFLTINSTSEISELKVAMIALCNGNSASIEKITDEFCTNLQECLEDGSYGCWLFDNLDDDAPWVKDGNPFEFSKLIARSWNTITFNNRDPDVTTYSREEASDNYKIYCFQRKVNGRMEYSVVYMQFVQHGTLKPNVFLFKIDAKLSREQKQVLLTLASPSPPGGPEISKLGPFHRFKFVCSEYSAGDNFDLIYTPFYRITDKQTVVVRECDIVLEMIKKFFDFSLETAPAAEQTIPAPAWVGVIE